MSSNVQVFVHWNNPTVFSGEDLECSIVFKNVAIPPDSPSEYSKRQQFIAPSHTALSGVNTPTLPNARISRPRNPGHRPTVSLDVPVSRAKVPGPGSWTHHPNGTPAYGQRHRRSVSIISLGGDLSAAREGVRSQGSGQVSAARRPVRDHTRSASLQVLPRWSAGTDAGPQSGTQHCSARQWRASNDVFQHRSTYMLDSTLPPSSILQYLLVRRSPVRVTPYYPDIVDGFQVHCRFHTAQEGHSIRDSRLDPIHQASGFLVPLLRVHHHCLRLSIRQSWH